MEIKFATGISIVIDDDNLLNWEQNERIIRFTMKDKRIFEVDIEKSKFYEIT